MGLEKPVDGAYAAIFSSGSQVPLTSYRAACLGTLALGCSASVGFIFFKLFSYLHDISEVSDNLIICLHTRPFHLSSVPFSPSSTKVVQWVMSVVVRDAIHSRAPLSLSSDELLAQPLPSLEVSTSVKSSLGASILPQHVDGSARSPEVPKCPRKIMGRQLQYSLNFKRMGMLIV
jgi:hypothetical protein